MNLFSRRHDTATPPASVAEADVLLLLVRDEYNRTCTAAVETNLRASPRRVYFAQVEFVHRKLDAFLEARLELDRRERAGQIETWWWGPVPQWPLGQSEVGR